MQAKRVLPIIVVAQFLCTSLWFAGNAAMQDLTIEFHAAPEALRHLISAVQFGFIAGTLSYALLAIADRFSPSKVFFLSAVLASISNLAITLISHKITLLLTLRFLTGFFLAGIYPVGMKIAADHFGKDLGKVLGLLVGALVFGTALPHLVKGYSGELLWRWVFIFTSVLAAVGGLSMLLIKDGPYRKAGQRINLSVFKDIFRNPGFRSASFGYFGHMWELYTFWAFVPFLLRMWQTAHSTQSLDVPVNSFIIIAGGGLSCIAAGYTSQNIGARKTAFTALLLSGVCCCLSPLIVDMTEGGMMCFLIFWGWVVVADSPMFSTLVAQNADPETKGTALTMVTCIGFSITIISIELINLLQPVIPSRYLFLFLAPGPFLGLLALSRSSIKREHKISKE